MSAFADTSTPTRLIGRVSLWLLLCIPSPVTLFADTMLCPHQITGNATRSPPTATTRVVTGAMSPTPMRPKCRSPSGYAYPSLNLLSPGLYFNNGASKGHTSDAEADSSDITMGVRAEMAHPTDGQSLINWACTVFDNIDNDPNFECIYSAGHVYVTS